MELLLTLSNATPVKDDTLDFYQNKIFPKLVELSCLAYKNFNFTNLLGDTLVHICTYNRLTKTLKAIYRFCNENGVGLDLTLCDGKAGQTPIAIAAIMGNVDLVEWFIDIGKATPTSENPVWRTMRKRTDFSGKLPVFYAAAFAGNEDIRKKLVELLDPKNILRHLFDLNRVSADYVINNRGYVYPGTKENPILRDCFGRTEFMMDVFMQNTDGIKAKLAACKSSIEKRSQLVNAQDYCGRSALIYACYMGFSDVVDILRAVADVNQADNLGQLPLHFAVLYAYKLSDPSQIIQMLLNSSAMNLSNHHNLTPLDFAMIIESETAQKLIRGAELQSQALAKPFPVLTQQFDALALTGGAPTNTTISTCSVSVDDPKAGVASVISASL